MSSRVTASRSKTGARKAIALAPPHRPSNNENENEPVTLATIQPSRKGRDRRASDKLAAQINEKQEAANKRAELKRLQAERQKLKAKALKKAIPASDEEDEEDTNERPNNTFSSKVVPAKPAMLVERAQKVPPSSKVFRQRENDKSDSGDGPPYTGDGGWPPRLRDDQDDQDDHQSEEEINDEENNTLEDDEDHDGFNESTLPASPGPYLQSTSQDDSQAVHQKRKRQDVETTSSSDADNDHATGKAQKINSKAGRPRAGDYEDLAKELILQAASVYRCLLSTEDGFPELAQEAQMVKRAWAHANKEIGLTHLGLTPDIAKIIKARGSQARGEIKEKTKPLVEGLFGFDSGHGRKAIVANRRWAEELKRERGFIYKTIIVESETEEPERKGMYQHPIIQKAVNVMWFQNKRDEGVRYRDMFKPVPIAAIALVLTAIEANIDEWLSGIKVAVTFWADEYRPIYHSHLEGLKDYGKHTAKLDLLGRLQRRLFNYGCHHAGIAPNEFTSQLYPVVPASAYAAALKEYEDDSSTDSEGDMRTG